MTSLLRFAHGSLRLKMAVLLVAVSLLLFATARPSVIFAGAIVAGALLVGAFFERALHQSEARFRRLTESGIIGIVLSDTAGRITEANDAFLTIVGYSREELLAGKLDSALLNTPEKERTDAGPLTKLETQGRAAAWEKALVRKDGSLVPVLVGVAMLDDAKGQFVAFVIDLTEHKRAETALRRSEASKTAVMEAAVLLRREKEAAQEANRELEAFSYSVAHDLRAPLRAISGFSRAFLEDHGRELDDAGRAQLGRVTTSAERMGQMIDSLLSLARLTRTAVRRERVDMTEIATTVMAQLQASDPGRSVELVVKGHIMAEGDPRLLRTVLENLLGNAWKFTRHQPHPRIEVGCTESVARGRTYYVRDNGAGFDMAYADKLFAPFQRLHASEDFEGTGVGLATVSRIVRRHGGRIWAQGMENGGATFHFTLSSEEEGSRDDSRRPTMDAGKLMS